MILLTVAKDDVKHFMNLILKETSFDEFEVRGVDILSFTHFSISCQRYIEPANSDVGEDASDSENYTVERAKYCKWSEIKPYALNIIRGGIKPRSMKIIFSMESDEAVKLHENAAAMYLNFNFNGEEINLTAAVSQRQFALDKSLDAVWENHITKFLKSNNVNYNVQ